MRRKVGCLAVLLAVAAAGCGGGGSGGGPPSAQKQELLIFVGAGIRPPVEELAQVFAEENRVEVVPDYAGSEVLFGKIKLGRRGDIYMPGDKHYVDIAADAGVIRSQEPVCYFVPTILVQEGNPKRIAGLADLVKPGVKLGLGDEKACAIGRKCRRIFAKNNIPWSEVERNLEFQSMTVNELGMQIQADSLDAVIVWDAVAAYYTEHGDEVPIPAEQNVISTVEAGVLTFTKHPELARQFIELARSERGREVFERHGYRVDPPE